MPLRTMLAVVAVASIASTSATASADPPAEHATFTFQFGDFAATGQLDYPAGARNAPVVVLIPGSGPEDLNADIGSSHIFLDIANDLNRRGYAVMRYNKRYVRGPGDVDNESYRTKLDLHGMRDDAEQVLQAAESDTHVDPRRVFLYGWSEGSTVAADLAVAHPELAGTIFQGPVALGWRSVFAHQTEFVHAPYLQRYAVDGTLGPAELQRAYSGDGGMEARAVLQMVCVDAPNGNFAVRPALDLDHDGTLDPNLEFRPHIEMLVDQMLAPGGSSIYSAGRTLPSVTEQAANLRAPVLTVQGAEDANVPPTGANALDAALGLSGNTDHTLRVFPGLGHSLGRTADTLRDDFQPIDTSALDVLGGWLDGHTR